MTYQIIAIIAFATGAVFGATIAFAALWSKRGKYIWCSSCGAIKPLEIAPMDGTNTTGEFSEPADLLCAQCHLVIATAYGKRL